MHSTSPSLIDPVAGAVDALVLAMSGGAVRNLTHDQLGDLVVATRSAQARLESVLLQAVGEVDSRGTFVHDGALTTGAWLRLCSRATPAEAAGSVRIARALRAGSLPETAAALAAGAISPQHARVIVTATHDAPGGAVALIEPAAVEAARTADVRAVASVMRQFSHALDPDGAEEDAVRRYERAGLTLSPTLDGSFALNGLADEVSGSTIATAVDAASPLKLGDRRTAARRRLDGLTEICRAYLASPQAPRRGAGGGHPHVIVTVDSDTLHRPDAPGSPGATLSWLGRITGATARRVACDAEVTTVDIGPDGEVRDSRSDRRFFSPAQRRAMIARDGDRCVAPYCDRPAGWSDAHHLRPWAAGGPTTVTNGALPCEGHHVLLHEGRWQLHRHPDGRYTLRHRNGRVIGPEPHPPGHNRPPPRCD